MKIVKCEEKALPWTQYSIKLQETLELDGSPVAVAITPDLPHGTRQLSRPVTVCVMLQIARRGSVFWTSGKGIICGARAHLGIGTPLIPHMDDFLVRQEKLFRSREAAKQLLASSRNMAPKKGNYLTFSPLEKANFVPDIVVFVATPVQISRIIFLDAFETGEFDLVHAEPLCTGTIAAPITTGKIGVSFLDMACRIFGKYKPEEMVVGIPYQRLLRIINSIEHSAAGLAEPSYFIRIAGDFLQRHVP